MSEPNTIENTSEGASCVATCSPSGESLAELAERIGWDAFCDLMEKTSPPLHDFLETWGKYCGAPRDVFRGQLCSMIVKHVALGAELSEENSINLPEDTP